MPNQYLNQCWNIVNWTLRNKLLIDIHTFSFKEMHLKLSAAKWRPFCPGREELTKDVICKLSSHMQMSPHTVECSYNAIQFITVLHMALRWRQLNINQTSNSQQVSRIALDCASELCAMKYGSKQVLPTNYHETRHISRVSCQKGRALLAGYPRYTESQ